jgi:hypothetical protein
MLGNRAVLILGDRGDRGGRCRTFTGPAAPDPTFPDPPAPDPTFTDPPAPDPTFTDPPAPDPTFIDPLAPHRTFVGQAGRQAFAGISADPAI